ncbi:hypothetical protein [Verrucosispora sp. WMMC514]|uniref:hypothetical protein n=1 Tax=Verrucosispora sp. WMMC514 TaxID=3015156 RepID=UPI00248D00A7|nr:hypothetical protein [Verrucosispora sp. WMMC514]WBB94134.1 hypothetical protein O7597_14895 [Verrucosispora sp. WMMC514]
MLITHGELVATQEKIAKINARAERRGFTGRLLVEAKKVIKKETNDLGFEVEEILYETTVTGEAPSYNGWKISATLDFDPEAGLIVRTAPGVEKVDRDGLVEGWCDHCRKNRHRSKTYLVHNATTGEQRQVGSTCIKDFLGWSGNVVFFSTGSIEEEIDGLLAGGGYYDKRWSAATVLAVAWAAIQAYGFKPVSSYDGTPTKSVVLTVLDPNPRSARDRELVEALRPYVERSAAQAQIVRDWLLSDAFSGDTEYVRNMKAVAGAETVSARHVGLLASAPQAWARAMERDLIRRRESEELVNEFTGQPGERLELTVRVKSIRYTAGDWGTTTIYTLVGDDKRVYKWFASTDALGETADVVRRIKGTVKKHDEYEGTRSTVLTRCKVLA